MEKLIKGINAPAVPIENLTRPAVGIVYGAGIQYHKEQIESLLDETDVLILGGGMIFAFYKAQGLSVGSTTVSDEEIQLAKSILDKAKAKGLKLVLPTHVVVADSDDEYYANTKVINWLIIIFLQTNQILTIRYDLSLV